MSLNASHAPSTPEPTHAVGSSAPVGRAATALTAPPTLPGWHHLASGKVRELYVPAPDNPSWGDDVVMMVASDRISAFDYVLTTPVPDKGRVLTALTLWWFERLADVRVAGRELANHLVSLDVPRDVAGRAMICRRLAMYPVECVARGYLTGSGLAEYRASGEVCGVALPAGLEDGSRLAEAIFTPAAKAELGAHDENVTFARVGTMVGVETAALLREATLAVYTRAEEIARERGILLADTKIELGSDPVSGDPLVLGDEVLTPDSSRFWDAATWEPGRAQASFDKQFVRDWLTSPASGWDRACGEAPPALPDEVVHRTRERYLAAYERLTGSSLG